MARHYLTCTNYCSLLISFCLHTSWPISSTDVYGDTDRRNYHRTPVDGKLSTAFLVSWTKLPAASCWVVRWVCKVWRLDYGRDGSSICSVQWNRSKAWWYNCPFNYILRIQVPFYLLEFTYPGQTIGHLHRYDRYWQLQYVMGHSKLASLSLHRWTS